MSYSFAATGERFEQRERHSKEDALTDHEFEMFYEGAQQLPDDYYGLQALFIIIVAGRLGLRRAEIAHMDESWIDWDDKIINIPRHQECNCGDCKQKAQQKAEHNDNITTEEALETRWHPKTVTAIREVPFGFSARAEVVIDRFFQKYDEYPLSVMSITRRVNRVADNVVEINEDEIYPHALRATAATYHSGRGLGVTPLQSMFGWCDLETPMKYVKSSGKNTDRELRNIHNR